MGGLPANAPATVLCPSNGVTDGPEGCWWGFPAAVPGKQPPAKAFHYDNRFRRMKQRYPGPANTPPWAKPAKKSPRAVCRGRKMWFTGGVFFRGFRAGDGLAKPHPRICPELGHENPTELCGVFCGGVDGGSVFPFGPGGFGRHGGPAGEKADAQLVERMCGVFGQAAKRAECLNPGRDFSPIAPGGRGFFGKRQQGSKE